MNSKIDWARNYRGHASTAQSSIWHCLKMLSNFEAVEVTIDDFDGESVIEGEKDFYSFMKTLYQDMYRNPDKYAIPTTAYDEYMETINPDEYYATNGHKKSDAKEGRLRQEFQDSIEFYPDYFYQLGLAGGEICKETFALVIPKSKYKDVFKTLDSLHSGKGNEHRINALTDRGIIVNERGENYYISCAQAPKMFLGLRVLCAPPEYQYKYMNYLRLAYKSYCGRIPHIEDIMTTMEKEHAEVLRPLVSLLDSAKTKMKLHPLKSITSNHKWKVEYIVKSKRVFEFYAGPAYLVFHLFFRDTESLAKAVKVIYETDSGLFVWLDGKFKEKLCNCPRNKTVLFGNHIKRICGSTNQVEIMDPDEHDTKNSIALIKILSIL